MSRVNSKPNSKVQSRAPSLPQSRVNSKPSSKVASKVASKVNSRANSDVNLKSRSKVNSAKQSTVELQKEVEQVVAVGAAEEPAIVAAPEQVQAEPNVPEQVATENEQEQRPPEEIQEPIQKHDSTVELNMLDPTILSEALQPLKFNALQEDDEQYTDFSVIPKTTRILTSPLPTEMDGFTFINVDYDMDPDLPVLTNTKLSRSNSWDYGIDKPVRKGVLEEYDVFLGVLRASTPVKEVEENVSVEVEPVIIDFIDREALISDIRQIIEQREKLLIKNQMFQNALGDHFKRKRVFLNNID